MVTSLERELESTKEHLQTTIEEMETSNEELKSTNEELRSVNEALQIIAEIKEGKEVKSFKTKRKTKEGKVLDVWLTVARLVDEAGRPVGVATTERDLAWLSD